MNYDNQNNMNNGQPNNNMNYSNYNQGNMTNNGFGQPNNNAYYQNNAVHNMQSNSVNNYGYQDNMSNVNYNNMQNNTQQGNFGGQYVNTNYQNYNQYSNNGMNYQNYNPSYMTNSQFGNSYSQAGTIKQDSGKSKKIIIIIFAIILLALIGFLLVKHFGGGINKNFDYDRTIMIYMVGSDLESGNIGAGTLDLNGIDYSKQSSQNTKVILIAGGSKRWHNNFIDLNSTSIYELTSSGYNIVKKQEVLNMGTPTVLQEFLDYGYNNYPSKKYDLVFWNHGLGAIGGEADELADDFLSLSEMREALNNSKFNKNNKLELVIFRTCLNGTLEVADTFKDYANYLVASQEVSLVYIGNNVLKTLNSINKDDNGKQIGTKFVDGYMEYID